MCKQIATLSLITLFALTISAQRTVEDSIYFKSGLSLLEKGQYQRAISSFTKLIKTGTKNGRVFLHRARALIELGKYSAALSDLDNAIELNDKDAWAYAERGAINYRLEKYEDSARDSSKALQLSPRYRSARYNLGLVHISPIDN